MTLAAIEDNIISSSSTTIDISFKVTILNAICFVARSCEASEDGNHCQLLPSRRLSGMQ